MRLLAIDVGSSSVKACLLQAGRPHGRIAKAPFPTRREGDRTDVDADELLGAVRRAVSTLGSGVRSVDAIVHDGMGPSWVALDRKGRPLTPIVTHQDRRSIDEAREIERRVGKARHLKIVGARPVPGGISSTTCLWHLRHVAGAMRRARLVGHVTTLLTHALTGVRAIDPSQASFTGLYETTTLAGWCDELIDAVGLDRSLLPDVRQANDVAGSVTPEAARRFGVRAGTPVVAGLLDGSAGMLAAGAATGQLMNSTGTTDILALAVDRPRPHEGLLTRALGIDGKWLAVATISAAGSALDWLRSAMFREMKPDAFYRRVAKLARAATTSASDLDRRQRGDGRSASPGEGVLAFHAHLAGSRTSVEPVLGTLVGLRLGTTRDDVLAALLAFLAAESGRRVALFESMGLPMRNDVLVTGGASGPLAKVLRRDWPGRFRFRARSEATLKGLSRISPR